MSLGPETCAGGFAADFACGGVDLLARIPSVDLDGGSANDLWGWFDAPNVREYALVALTNGTAFIDVTDPVNPEFLGHLPTQTVSSDWRDIKVYENHAFIVADGAGAHGMQVFDLTRLRAIAAPQDFVADVVYGDFANAHNLAINEASGFAYAVGTNTCSEGLHIIDIRTPNSPIFAGCHDLAETHDTQCVTYQGPDVAYTGREICFSSNQDHVGVADVTDLISFGGASTQIASVDYPNVGFTHQGWLTEDHRYFLLGDELDELSFGVPTRTHVFDMADLDMPVYLFVYEGPTFATDHNLYVLGNRVYEANYASGLSVLEMGDLLNGELSEVAYFDTFPASDLAGFSGAWSVYPYLPSGTVLVSDRSNGLFVLELQ